MIADAIKLYILIGCALAFLYTLHPDISKRPPIGFWSCLVLWPAVLWMTGRLLTRKH